MPSVNRVASVASGFRHHSTRPLQILPPNSHAEMKENEREKRKYLTNTSASLKCPRPPDVVKRKTKNERSAAWLVCMPLSRPTPHHPALSSAIFGPVKNAQWAFFPWLRATGLNRTKTNKTNRQRAVNCHDRPTPSEVRQSHLSHIVLLSLILIPTTEQTWPVGLGRI